MRTPQLILHQLCYQHPHQEKCLIKDLSLSLGQSKVGIVGRNGSGKTTLLRLIAGELNPTSGGYTLAGTVSYCRQQPTINPQTRVADLLAVEEIYDAILRIRSGSIDHNDYLLVENDWDLEQRAQTLLKDIELEKLNLQTQVIELSGGQQTRLQLAAILFKKADFLLLDEPSNHLDLSGRDFLIEIIRKSLQGMLIASHDRELLSLMDTILEITPTGIMYYGGNYEHYREQKTLNEASIQHQLEISVHQLAHSKQSLQERMKIHSRKQAKGIRTRKSQILAKGQINKIEMNSAKGRSEKTQRRITVQYNRRLQKLNQSLKEVKKKVFTEGDMRFSMDSARLPENKMILEIENLSYSYHGNILFENLKILVHGSQRIAITGQNGCGKSTLFKLITGEIAATTGNIKIGAKKLAYLDQKAETLDPTKTVIENFSDFNPEISPAKCHLYLAQFLFPNLESHKKIAELSGGEKLRALLACILFSKEPPQLLLLDEPTNHLDSESVLLFEEALRNYEGAMMVISHDRQFLKNILITEYYRIGIP